MKLEDLLGTDNKDVFTKISFDKMFRVWNEGKNKARHSGLHASSIIAPKSDFCYREHILMLNFPKEKEDIIHSVGLLRIFLNGWYVHIKWQKLFEDAGIAIETEKTRKSKDFDLYFTPDAIINLFKKKVVVEIKSMNTFQFKHLKSPPKSAVRQCQFYMHKTQIKHGLILIEDKNSQDYLVFHINYDEEISKPFIKRLEYLDKMQDILKNEGKVPKRLCEGSKCKRALQCPIKLFCFKIGNKI